MSDMATEIVGTYEGLEYDAVTENVYGKVTKPDKVAVLADVRHKLDAGLGNELMKKRRDLIDAAKDGLHKHEYSYELIIMGALFMSLGAKISDEDMQYMRQATSGITCSEGITLLDIGWRGPGQRQFLAALDHYTPGTPRNFSERSCHACGKTKVDIGRALLRCSRCSSHAPGWLCDKECQRSAWSDHKKVCGPPRDNGKFVMLNV
ncbi:hypothetical protein VTJ49DRAFT_6371 [Mycothermus thermophilus]|uniref:MYND-type domain-containing protein n=1 Tax=Humicola insolens TaxID=85995 RepID=A0ABR3VQD1_HUMIN